MASFGKKSGWECVPVWEVIHSLLQGRGVGGQKDTPQVREAPLLLKGPD